MIGRSFGYDSAVGYDRRAFGHKIGKDHVSNCFSYVIPDVCYRESTLFDSAVFSGYPIKTFGYDRGEVRAWGRGLRAQNREGSCQQPVFRMSFPTFVIGNTCLLNPLFFLDTR